MIRKGRIRRSMDGIDRLMRMMENAIDHGLHFPGVIEDVLDNAIRLGEDGLTDPNPLTREKAERILSQAYQLQDKFNSTGEDNGNDSK